MKKIFFLFVLIFVMTGTLCAQGISFEHVTFSEALAKSKKDNKLLFVDFYTDWCVPCKKMTAETFSLPSVGSIFNDRFIAIKVDAEKGEGIELAKKYKVNAFPTMFWMNSEGKIVYTVVGYRNEPDFLKEIERINKSAEFGGLEAMTQQFRNGSNDPVFLLNFYKLLAEKDPMRPKVALQYLNSLPDDQLFDQDNEMTIGIIGDMIDVVNMFDKRFFYHYAEELKKRVDAGMKISKSYSLGVAFTIQLKIRDFLNAAISKPNKQLFDDLVAYQEKWPNHSYKNRDGDTNLQTGRGIGFASSDFLKLQYMFVNDDNPNLFKQMLVPYMTNLMQDSSAYSANKRLNNLLNRPDRKKGFNDMLYMLFKGYKDISMNNIINWTDYFWKNSPSDKRTREQVSTWAFFAGEFNPLQSGLVIEAAILINRTGDKNKALALLDKTITLHNKMAIKNKDRIVKNLENAKRDIINKKV
ncbi:thioredoxin family protein [Pedobacter africanus]|uniref:Thioredoxin n=1 Tax=Pedobacter africanus TaxID=151894 RepID=A0A1W2CSG5_9SPHI|nr:thioredoxin fold domain-containing protein [Pedobacter africanus]SMC87618.1 Thioredoxin [Pedobacter africanus]